MRLKPPPPDVCVQWHGTQADLLRALSTALSAVAVHERALSRTLSELGDLDLPDGAPNAMDVTQLQAAGPLYFASELEQAGLLSTAELVAGLFASGAITQPLGPVAQQINAFWRARRERLEKGERDAIFARVIEAPYFDRLMTTLCTAIVAQADGNDLREGVALSATAQGLAEFLAQRVDAMASIAVRDIVDSINAGLGFLRDRLLQTAFGVRSLWQLMAVTANTQGSNLQGSAATGAGDVQRHVDRGRAGQTVLLWLSANFGGGTIALDPNRAEDIELMMSAQRWLDAASLTRAPAPSAMPALPIAA